MSEDTHSHKQEARRVAPRLLANPAHFLSLGFGAGLVPRLPGTAGTLVAVPLWYGLANIPLSLYVCVWIGLFLAGIWLCAYTARALGVHDHPGIVWDEIVGFLVTMTGLPSGWVWALAGFVLFRILDILKPWPINLMDRHIHGGFGIMVDDLAAGAIACAFLHSVAYMV
ncbi:MAG: phosphatidylglycerophosphatase A family protein [Candidatus Eutrophobiaceae bacterium]